MLCVCNIFYSRVSVHVCYILSTTVIVLITLVSLADKIKVNNRIMWAWIVHFPSSSSLSSCPHPFLPSPLPSLLPLLCQILGTPMMLKLNRYWRFNRHARYALFLGLWLLAFFCSYIGLVSCNCPSLPPSLSLSPFFPSSLIPLSFLFHNPAQLWYPWVFKEV